MRQPFRRRSSQGDAAGLQRLIAACDQAGVPREALLLRRSKLPRAMALPHVLARMRETLEALLHADRAQEFCLPNTDLVVVWRGDALRAVQATLQAVRYFCLARRLVAVDGSLTERFSLPADRAALERAIDAAQSLPAPEPDAEAACRVLDMPTLAALEAQLARADLSGFMRRRDVCAVDAEGRFVLRWEKRFVSIPALAAAVCPDRSLRGDPWLFRRLSRTLERRMLALLAAPGELRGAAPFGIGLSVASLLSPEFLRFDDALPRTLRGKVVLGIAPCDALADPAAFLFAREFARARGYRLLLRQVGADLLSVLPLDRTGLDLLQLAWSPALREARLPTPPACIVLAGADCREAVAWGRSLGVEFFQGALVARGLMAAGAVRSPMLALGEAAAAA